MCTSVPRPPFFFAAELAHAVEEQGPDLFTGHLAAVGDPPVEPLQIADVCADGTDFLHTPLGLQDRAATC